MIKSENMQKIVSNENLETISVVQLSQVLCELEMMGALTDGPWVPKEREEVNV